MGVQQPQESPIRRISGSKLVHWINEALVTIVDPVYLRFQSQITRVQIQNVYLVLKANGALLEDDDVELEYHEVMRQLLRIDILDLLLKLHWAARCQHRESSRILFRKILFLRDAVEHHIKAIKPYPVPLEVDIINTFGLSFLNCINKKPLDPVLVKDAQGFETVMKQTIQKFFNLCLSGDGYISPNVQITIYNFVSYLHLSLHSYASNRGQKTC